MHRLIYPSTDDILPGTRVNFWNYNAKGRGWYVYGLGTAMPEGGGIVPDPRVSVYEFTGAMVAGPEQKPAQAPPPGGNTKAGDPVDLSTGLFVLEKTDLVITDVLPVVLRRTYRPGDTWSRAFGLGTTHPYDMFLVGDTFPYTYMDLVLPDGGSIHYTRISPGTSFTDAVYETTVSPTRFYKSRIAWDGAHFFLTLKDGTVYTFREAFGGTRPMQGGLLSIRDRAGNTLTMTRDLDGNLTRITTPGGRWVDGRELLPEELDELPILADGHRSAIALSHRSRGFKCRRKDAASDSLRGRAAEVGAQPTAVPLRRRPRPGARRGRQSGGRRSEGRSVIPRP